MPVVTFGSPSDKPPFTLWKQKCNLRPIEHQFTNHVMVNKRQDMISSDCDAAPGQSGSAIFNKNNKIVALLNGGLDGQDPNNREKKPALVINTIITKKHLAWIKSVVRRHGKTLELPPSEEKRLSGAAEIRVATISKKE
eukprot:Pgem_evm1s20167